MAIEIINRKSSSFRRETSDITQLLYRNIYYLIETIGD